MTQLEMTRAGLVLAGCALGILFFAQRKAAAQKFLCFFNWQTRPITLAVIRIVIFSHLWKYGQPKLEYFTQLPESMRVAPPGYGPWFDLVPFDTHTALLIKSIYAAACLMACAGLFTRAAAWTTVITGIYVLGIPQLFGKIGHNHHLVWFAAILAASPCADVLSLDSLRQAWRAGYTGRIQRNSKSVIYGRPLQIAWIIIGLIYFFPGFWKLWDAGYAWITSDNMKYILWRNWLLKDILPGFRIDYYPLLCRLGAALAVFFELSVIFLVFFRRLHWLIIAGGIAFHSATTYFMQIFFRSLLKSYVFFINTDAMTRRLRRILKLPLLYLRLNPRNTAFCRAVNMARSVDLFHQMRVYTEKNGNFAIRSEGSGRELTEAGALRKLFVTLPACWILLPAFEVFRLAGCGGLARQVFSASVRPLQADPPAEMRGPAMSNVTGAVLIAALIFCSVLKIHSWPFSTYPTFSTRVRPVLERVAVEIQDSSGKKTIISPNTFINHFDIMRWPGLELSLLRGKTPEIRKEKVRTFVAWILRQNPSMRNAAQINVYKVLKSTDPDQGLEKFVSQELLYTYRPETG